MSQHTEQLIGALFNVLTDRGYTDTQQLLLETYQQRATADRDELTQNLFTEFITVLDQHLSPEAEADVLETAIQYLGNRLTAVIETAPIAIIVVDATGSIQLWNNGAACMFGWSESKVLDRSYPELLSKSASTTDSFLSDLRGGDQLTGIETTHKHRNGTSLDVRIWAAPLMDADGQFDGATFAITDITGKKQREQRLSVLNRVLRHNIRTDVNVIQGHLSILANELSEDNNHVSVIEQRLANMTELSDAARRISQLDGQSDGKIKMFDLNQLITEQISRLQNKYSSAVMNTTIPQAAPVIGHELLPSALDNVLENAIIHNPSATPHVDVTVDEPNQGDNFRTLHIIDDGPGLPTSEQEVLTADTEAPLNHSSGVGLWLTKWIIQFTDGKITVDTPQSGGTCVQIQLRVPADH